MKEIRRILIVDDERVMTDYLRDLLQDRFELATATSYREAMALLSEQPCDLVLTDLQLEDKESGLNLLEACRKLQNPVPVIVMTTLCVVPSVVATVIVSVNVVPAGRFWITAWVLSAA